VTSFALASLDWALRGGTVALVLLLAAALMRDHGRLLAARLGAAFALGTAAYAIASAAGFSPRVGLWTWPLMALSAGNNVVFWTFSAALFDDGFKLRWWHPALWLLLVVAGVAECSSPTPLLGIVLTLSSIVFAALAMGQAIVSWRIDLIERRRRLRLFVVVASALYIVGNAAAQLAGVPRSAPAEGSLAGGIGLLAIAGAIAWQLVRVAPHSLFPMLAEALPGREPVAAPADDVDQRLLATLGHIMTSERAYRQDGLTVASLARQVGVPEYKLRRLINQGLGHRNFNSYVNSHRIAEARAALADPHQVEVPVLTIALDAGFSSLGPFNRAFKAETGVTPTEYRRLNSGIGQPLKDSASLISNPASRNVAAH
jgi:AraC-like DNA-binding protein